MAPPSGIRGPWEHPRGCKGPYPPRGRVLCLLLAEPRVGLLPPLTSSWALGWPSVFSPGVRWAWPSSVRGCGGDRIRSSGHKYRAGGCCRNPLWITRCSCLLGPAPQSRGTRLAAGPRGHPFLVSASLGQQHQPLGSLSSCCHAELPTASVSHVLWGPGRLGSERLRTGWHREPFLQLRHLCT